MSIIAFTKTFPDSMHQQVAVVQWPDLANGDEGKVIEFAQYPDRSVQVAGTFGGGGAVVFEGSNDGLNWATLTDPQGNPLNFTSAKIEEVAELVRYVRPRVTAGDGGTSITVTAVMRGHVQ
jgi:hypothetical protein